MNPNCPIELPEDAVARRRRRALEEDALAAQSRIPDEVERLSRDLLSLKKELEKTRGEFARYQAEQAARYERDRLEQAKTNKQNFKRSLVQVVVSVILSNLVPMLVKYCQLIAVWIRSAFH